jgi:hypothetical protein
MAKVVATAAQAVADITDGSSPAVGDSVCAVSQKH